MRVRLLNPSSSPVKFSQFVKHDSKILQRARFDYDYYRGKHFVRSCSFSFFPFPSDKCNGATVLICGASDEQQRHTEALSQTQTLVLFPPPLSEGFPAPTAPFLRVLQMSVIILFVALFFAPLFYTSVFIKQIMLCGTLTYSSCRSDFSASHQQVQDKL